MQDHKSRYRILAAAPVLAAVLLSTAAFSKPAEGASLAVPQIEVEVGDLDGGFGVSGVEVDLLLREKKKNDFKVIGSTVTGGDGRAQFGRFGSDIYKLGMRFSWQDGQLPRRSMLFEMRVKKGEKTSGGRRIRPSSTGASYRLADAEGGDCDNLFSWSLEDDALVVQFRRPSTYASCEDVGFKYPDQAQVGQRDINAGTRNFYSFDNDLEMGQSFVNEMSDEQPVLEDAMVQSYVQGLIDRIGRASDMPDLDYRVQVIDADVMNAFALPGGYVFVYRGLIEASENESELVGVLAHEVAHVTGRHGTEGMTSAMTKMGLVMVLGGVAAKELTDDRKVQQAIQTAAMAGTNLWVVGGTRKREAEADRLGAQYAWRAGYDPRGLGTFFGKLAQGRKKKAGRIDKLFSDHPSDEERVRSVEEMTGYFLPAKDGLIVSSPEYEAVKRRLAELPPAKVGGQPAAEKIFSAFAQTNSSLMWEQFLSYVESGKLSEGGSS